MKTIGLRVSALSALLLTVALAGCSDEAPKALDSDLPLDAVISEDGRDLRTDLLVTDELPGPEWAIGDWFGHHVFIGPDDTEGTHINVIVTEDRGSDWFLVSENDEISMFEALFDVPIAGVLAKDNLDTTAFGGDWQIYSFPLSNNKTWKGDITLGNGDSTELTYTATYQDSFKTGLGNRPGFLVNGVDDMGRLVIETNYVPAIGWYTEFNGYEVEGEEPELVFRSISMGTGHNWTGEFTHYEASPLIDVDQVFYPDPATGLPAHQEALSIPESASTIIGVMYSFAVAGASELRLMDPDNNVAVQHSNIHTPPADPDPNQWGGIGGGDLYIIDAVPGDWQLLWGGPAFVSGFGAELYTLESITGTL